MQRDRLFLAGMIDACERIVALTAGQDESTLTPTAREALMWNFTVLGEAANQVSPEVRAAEAAVPWRRATALRNRIVHGYWSVDIDLLVTTAHEAVPDLLVLLRSLVARSAD